MTTRSLSALSLLVLLSACTIELSPYGPPEDSLPSDTDDMSEGEVPEDDTAFSITWTEVADAPLARFEGQSAVVGEKLYVFGVYTDGSVVPKTFEADVYDPASDTWERLPDLPRPIIHASTTAHGTDIWRVAWWVRRTLMSPRRSMRLPRSGVSIPIRRTGPGGAALSKTAHSSLPRPFTSVLEQQGVQISLDGKGSWIDNVFIERFRRSLKYEEVYLVAYDDLIEARAGLVRYLSYNYKRRHTNLRKQTPDEVYHQATSNPARSVLKVAVRPLTPKPRS